MEGLSATACGFEATGRGRPPTAAAGGRAAERASLRSGRRDHGRPVGTARPAGGPRQQVPRLGLVRFAGIQGDGERLHHAGPPCGRPSGDDVFLDQPPVQQQERDQRPGARRHRGACRSPGPPGVVDQGESARGSRLLQRGGTRAGLRARGPGFEVVVQLRTGRALAIRFSCRAAPLCGGCGPPVPLLSSCPSDPLAGRGPDRAPVDRSRIRSPRALWAAGAP
jgi:hypothetical protein